MSRIPIIPDFKCGLIHVLFYPPNIINKLLANLMKIKSLYQESSQKGDSGCASEKLGVPHLLSD